MFEHLLQILPSLLGGSVSGAIVVALIWHQVRTDQSKIAAAEEQVIQLNHKLESLEKQEFQSLQNMLTEHIKNAENEMKEHVSKDRTQEILTEIKHLTGSITGLADKMSRCLEGQAGIIAEVTALRKYVDGVDTSVRELRSREN